MEPEDLIGKYIKGFEFNGHPTHTPGMKNYDGVVGKITNLFLDVCQIEFPDGRRYNYPVEEAFNHLIEEIKEVEEEIDLEALFKQIKNLK
jgi:hypothetical protein